MFLPNLDEALRIVASNEAFEASSFERNGYRIYNFGYRLPSYMDFEDPIPGSGLKAHELRGLTFIEAPDGSVSRHLLLRKFHALNQTTGFMLKDIIDKPDKKIVSCSEKLDGSIVRFISIGNEILARTKSSFSGPHARLAQELMANTSGLRDFIHDAHQQGLAPIFEMIGPEWKIVVEYDNTELRLIQMRDETTGELVDIANHPIMQKHDIQTSLVPGIRTMEQVMEYQETRKGVEGLVVLFSDNSLMKCKTRWYDDFHDFFFEKQRTDKKMVAMVLNETMDDALASMSNEDPVKEKAELVFNLVSHHVNQISDKITDAVSAFEGSTPDNDARKAFTMTHRGDPLLGLYMQALKNNSSRGILDLAKNYVGGMAKNEEGASKLIRKLQAETSVELKM
jgi:RNA ligase